MYMKNCPYCMELKPIERFSINSSNSDGFHKKCKDCTNLMYREKYRFNRLNNKPKTAKPSKPRKSNPVRVVNSVPKEPKPEVKLNLLKEVIANYKLSIGVKDEVHAISQILWQNDQSAGFLTESGTTLDIPNTSEDIFMVSLDPIAKQKVRKKRVSTV